MQKIARRKVAAYVAEQLQAGGTRKDLVRSLAAYLVENKLASDTNVDLLLRDVETLLESDFGITTARVRTARPLDAVTRKNIKTSLAEQTGAKDVIIIDEILDPELIGGVVIETPSSIFDSSIAKKLQQLAAITKE